MNVTTPIDNSLPPRPLKANSIVSTLTGLLCCIRPAKRSSRLGNEIPDLRSSAKLPDMCKIEPSNRKVDALHDQLDAFATVQQSKEPKLTTMSEGRIASKELQTQKQQLQDQKVGPLKPEQPQTLARKPALAEQTMPAPPHHTANQRQPFADSAPNNSAPRSHGIGITLLREDCTPASLVHQLKSDGYQHINVSGEHLDCGLRATLLCLLSHFAQLPEKLKIQEARVITDYFPINRGHQAQSLARFLLSGADGASNIRTQQSTLKNRLAEKVLINSLGSLVHGLYHKQLLSKTTAEDVQSTARSAGHMLSNDAMAELLSALKVPGQIITFGGTKPQMETVRAPRPKLRSNNANPVPQFSHSLPCVFLERGHYQILTPLPLYGSS